MGNTELREIIRLCLNIEKTAADAYRTLSEEMSGAGQQAFWQDILLDEKRHISYWEELFRVAEKGSPLNPFDDSQKAMRDLESVKTGMKDLLSQRSLYEHPDSVIFLVLRLEAFMLNPAFFILFRSLKDTVSGDSPEDDYKQHIEKFLHFSRTFFADRPELELVCDILMRMWDHGREVANQFEHIKTLRGLIPICSGCKKVRDAQGDWKQIESYLGKHTEATFSHGICPDCREKLYPCSKTISSTS